MKKILLALLFAFPVLAETKVRNAITQGAIINILDKGAPCNGTADDAPAIALAVAALPTTGGFVDARGCTAGMRIATNLAISHHAVTILLPAAVVKLDDYLDVTGYDFHMIGAGMDTVRPSPLESTVVTVATNAGIRMGGTIPTPIWRWSLEKFSITPQASATPLFGVQLWSARDGTGYYLNAFGFSAATGNAGILVKDNCWGNRFHEIEVTDNDIGVSIVGNGANGNEFRGGVYSSNTRYGIYVAMGAGSLQGLYVTSNARFEGNGDSGIKIESGNINGFYVSNYYSELLSGTKRFLTMKGDGTNNLKVFYFDVKGGVVLAGSTVNPILLDSSQKVNDTIIGSVDTYGYSMTGGATALVDTVGGPTVLVQGRAAGVSDITPLHTTTTSINAVSHYVRGGTVHYRNNADTTLGLYVDSGLTTGQTSFFGFRDRGTTKHLISSAGGALFFNDTGLNLNKFILGNGNSSTDLNSAGATAIRLQVTANSGSAGVEFWSGGATPAKVNTIDSTGKVIFTGVTNAALGTPANGSMQYCSDCTIANPCAGGGTGALAKRLNGVWVCN